MGRRPRPLDLAEPWAPLAQRLRDLRTSTGLTLDELAERSHYSPTTLSRAMDGRPPSWTMVSAVLEACGVSSPDEIERWREAFDHVRTAQATTVPPVENVADPRAFDTPRAFFTGLRALHEQTAMSIRQQAAASGGRLAASTISDLLRGRIRPRGNTVLAYLHVCQNMVTVDVDAWMTAWRRVSRRTDPDTGTTDHAPTSDAVAGRPPASACGQTESTNSPAHSDHPRPAVAGGQARDNGSRTTVETARAAQQYVTAASTESSDATAVRTLASAGELATTYMVADQALQQALRRGLYEIAYRVVFQTITVRTERRRGHFDCMQGPTFLRDDCLDRFHEEVIGVVNATIARANYPIERLDAWMAAGATAFVIDSYRARRGSMGALQRPRIPRWLGEALDDDPWLMQLALHMATWVGIPNTAGPDLWPVDAWVDRRAAFTGDYRASDEATVRREIATVQAAMRLRPHWYARHIEQPLERKPAAISRAVRGTNGEFVEPVPLVLGSADEQDDVELTELAGLCIDAIAAKLGDPHVDLAAVVREVLETVFQTDVRLEAITDDVVAAVLNIVQ